MNSKSRNRYAHLPRSNGEEKSPALPYTMEESYFNEEK